MAKHHLTAIPLIFGLVLSNFVSTFGKLECEDLPVEDCAFSVASSGTRCVLEKYKGKDDSIRYECQSSIIMAEKQEEWIESDECIKSCGLERMSVGLSTDLLMDSRFAEMLCSSECLNNCPNLIDLYISLAAGEGVYLPQLCKTHRMSYRRVIADPVKKASDAEFRRRQQLLPSLTSGAMSPAASQTADSGAGTVPPTDGSTRPDYRGYVGGDYGGPGGYGGGHVLRGQELAPMSSPVPGMSSTPSPVLPSTMPTAPAAQTLSISANKRLFFVVSSLPTPEPMPSTTEPLTTPVADTPDTAVILIPLETSSKFIYASAPEPSPEQGSEFLLWQQQSTENLLPDRQQLNVDEEYLYETYFH